MIDGYIRKQDAITAACKGFCHPGVRCPDEPCMEQTKYLRELPPADVVEVKHGEWISECEPHYECSECHHWFHLYQYMKYCPNCGAKMDGGY